MPDGKCFLRNRRRGGAHAVPWSLFAQEELAAFRALQERSPLLGELWGSPLLGYRHARTPAAFSQWQPAFGATEQAVSNSLHHGPRVCAGGPVPGACLSPVEAA